MNTKQQKQADVWEKWDWLWKAIFFTTVLVSFILTLIVSDPTTSACVPGLLMGMMLLWHWGGHRSAASKTRICGRRSKDTVEVWILGEAVHEV